MVNLTINFNNGKNEDEILNRIRYGYINVMHFLKAVLLLSVTPSLRISQKNRATESEYSKTI